MVMMVVVVVGVVSESGGLWWWSESNGSDGRGRMMGIVVGSVLCGGE